MNSNLIRLQKALDANVIDDKTFQKIKEYTERLSQNNVPVIYNLRHVRKIFKITQAEQVLFFGSLRKQLYHPHGLKTQDGRCF